MSNPDANTAGDGFLASPSVLASLLAGLAAPPQRHSARARQDTIVAKAALKELFTVPMSTSPQLDSPEPPAPIEGKTASAPLSRRNSENNEPKTPRKTGIVTKDDLFRVRRRQFCQCGVCKWCIDNDRWERIFKAKFVDPTYYSGVMVRHNSTLAGTL